MFNIFANIVKRIGIFVADKVSSTYDPFEDFTRPMQEKQPELLSSKAQQFETDMKQRFSLMNGKIWNYKITINGELDLGDQAIWHGIYTSMWAFKYAVTQNEEDLNVLRQSVAGLHLHQMVGIGNTGRRQLIRGVNPEGKWQEDASNDSLSGHIAGIYFAWLYGSADIKSECQTLAKGIADELLANKYSLVNVDGKPTTHGKLIDGVLTDPLRLGLCLAVLKVAWKTSGEAKYQEQYKFLIDRYQSFVAYPKVKLLWWGTEYDTHRSALQLSILADLEENPDIKRLYISGLQRIWQMCRKTGNAWVCYLCARHVDDVILNVEKSWCFKMLKEFTLSDKNTVIEKLNSSRKDIKMVKWGNEYWVTQPLPRWQVGSQDFFWQRNLYAVDNWMGMTTPAFVHNGGDFLVAYWLGRKLNIISSNE